ncbi:Salicylic acid-binding protein 2 [Melia azedarach]|uniref:Salicylic acid-binding protein 2 n=1 Tax=Melia azedarach TaxID=155640 RepID=A0ACC1XUL5_MELAZ|nr:Salicylic acid-binding protein 2 [Melia azedarach]
MAEYMNQNHFVLVHGSNLGAWCWYKLKPWLQAAGYRVTAVDLAASGINMKAIQDVHTFQDYAEPLLEIMASLPPNKKVILVGHSLGGLSLALAMEKFPEKVLVAVFITAFMPDTRHHSSYIFDQSRERIKLDLQDNQLLAYDESKPSIKSIRLGPEYLASKLYQLSPTEDLELAKMSVRPGPLLPDEENKFTDEGYGSVERVYIVCDKDRVVPIEFQLWMIENNPVRRVFVIKGADHMPMFSKTYELCDSLLEIAHKHA